MARLYRSTSDCQHWLTWIEGSGWLRFPARANGWDERCPATAVNRRQLQRVPLRLAFHTGLLEFLDRHALDRAA